MVTEPKANYIRAVHGWSENTDEDMRTVGEAGTGGDGQDNLSPMLALLLGNNPIDLDLAPVYQINDLRLDRCCRRRRGGAGRWGRKIDSGASSYC